MCLIQMAPSSVVFGDTLRRLHFRERVSISVKIYTQSAEGFWLVGMGRGAGGATRENA
jgi:hypothetical protein